MAGLVLSDASPLIGLARVDGLAWLQRLFGQVHIPQDVRAEVMPGLGFPEEQALRAAESAGWLVVHAAAPLQPPLPDLDEGEAACIRIALAHVREHSRPALLLMDERAGRAIAVEHRMRVAGTAAVIGMARSRGMIGSAREVFARLHACDFRISAVVIETVLRQVGE